MTEDEIAKIVVNKSLEIHKTLGAGLLESVYQECLFYELTTSGLFTEREKALPVIYKSLKMEQGYRIDLLVESKVVIEIKTVDKLADVHTAQILTYMKIGGYKLGLLINFNTRLIKDGIRRYIM